MMRIAAFAIGALLMGSPAAAEVIAASPESFVSEHRASLAAAPEAAYVGIARIGEWWDPDHTYSRDSGNLALEARAGGCFCEALPAEGGSVEHMRVLQARPGRLLRLAGGLGPLQADPVAALLDFRLAPREGGGTELVMRYSVAGPMAMGGERLAPLVDAVLAGQFARLAAFLDGDAFR